jgi:hypothetical protein
MIGKEAGSISYCSAPSPECPERRSTCSLAPPFAPQSTRFRFTLQGYRSFPSVSLPSYSTLHLASISSNNTRSTRSTNHSPRLPSPSLCGHVASHPFLWRGGTSFKAISPSLLLCSTRPCYRRSHSAEFAPCREHRHQGQTCSRRLWSVLLVFVRFGGVSCMQRTMVARKLQRFKVVGWDELSKGCLELLGSERPEPLGCSRRIAKEQTANSHATALQAPVSRAPLASPTFAPAPASLNHSRSSTPRRGSTRERTCSMPVSLL